MWDRESKKKQIHVALICMAQNNLYLSHVKFMSYYLCKTILPFRVVSTSGFKIYFLAINCKCSAFCRFQNVQPTSPESRKYTNWTRMKPTGNLNEIWTILFTILIRYRLSFTFKSHKSKEVKQYKQLQWNYHAKIFLNCKHIQKFVLKHPS